MLRSYKKILLASLAGGLAAVGMGGSVLAASDTEILGVAATVETPVVPLSCSFGTIVAVGFSADIPTNTGTNTIASDSGSITFQCNKNATGLTIEMVGGSDRTLTNENNETLGYRMFQPNAEGASGQLSSDLWGTLLDAQARTVDAVAGTDKTLNVFASLDTNVDVTASTTYEEDVTVQINF